MYAAPQASASNGVGNGDGKPHVLVVPYPAQGHMLPLLDLAALLAALGLALTVAVTAGNVRLLEPFLAACPSVDTVVLPFPSSPFLPAGCGENTKDLPADLFRPFMASLAALSAPLLSWCKSQPHGVTAIVSDLFTGWTLPLAEELGVPHDARGLLVCQRSLPRHDALPLATHANEAPPRRRRRDCHLLGGARLA